MIKVAGIDAVGIANDYTVAGELAAAKAGNDNAKIISNYYPWWDSITKRNVLGFDRRPTHVVIPELNNVRRMFLIHQALERELDVISTHLLAGRTIVHVHADDRPGPEWEQVDAGLVDVYFSTLKHAGERRAA